MRRVLASLSSAVIALGLLIGVAPSAHAASITIGCQNDSQSVSVSVDETLSISVTGHPCFVDSTTGVGVFNPSTGYVAGATITFSSSTVGTATLTVSDNGINPTVLTINVGDSSTSVETDPALVYPTLYLNANGGTCTGTMQFTKYNGQNGQITVPTSDACTRSGYTLLGWSSSGDANSGVWLPGSMVPIGDESFTLYAAWFADGLEVTYDANVGMSTECVKDGANLSNVADRSVTRVITPRSEGEALRYDGAYFTTWTATSPAPVCSPPGYEFLGWSEFASGPAFKPSELMLANPSRPDVLGLFLPGTEITLYAQWGVTWGVQAEASTLVLPPGGTATLNVTALRNANPDNRSRVFVFYPGAGRVLPFSPSDPVTGPFATFVPNSDGTLSIPIYASENLGRGTIVVSYGNATQVLQFTVASPQPPSITITGERTTVSGKPGIRVDGNMAGLPEGTKVIPWFRFPGQTEYSQSSARPTTNADGEFVWQRKTGKKFYTYVTTEDGSVQSNRVIIPAK